MLRHIWNGCNKTFTKKKQEQNMKPWVTLGIQRSMKTREKIYTQVIKLKTEQNKTAKFEAYRKYCNKIIYPRILLDNPITNFFEQNMN